MFFVGFFDAFANDVVLSEIQSRWVANVIAGKIRLPSKEEMVAWTNKQTEKDLRRGGVSPMFRLNVPFQTMYAKELNIMPEKLDFDKPLLGTLFRSKL